MLFGRETTGGISAPPIMRWSGAPKIGTNRFSLQAWNVVESEAFLLVGTRRETRLVRRCLRLHVFPMFVFRSVVDRRSGGLRKLHVVRWTIPWVTGLVGRSLYCQWIIAAPTSRCYGLAASRGVRFTVVR